MINKVTFTMTDFRFPPNISDSYATYRMYFELTYRKSGGGTKVVTEVMPGADKGEYFECETGGHANDTVRYKDRSKIDLDRVTNKTWKRVVFTGIEAESLDELVVKLYDVDKDSKIGDWLRKRLKEIFPILTGLALNGTAFTIGNVFKAINEQDPNAERSEVEKKFAEILETTVKSNKTRPIMDDFVDLDQLASGSEIKIAGRGLPGMLKKKSEDLTFEVKFQMTLE